jgi:hypothetical protein
MYEVLVVKDGPDGTTEETTVESEWKTSPEANERVRQLKDEEQASKSTDDYEAGDKDSKLRAEQQSKGGAPKESEKTYGSQPAKRDKNEGTR